MNIEAVVKDYYSYAFNGLSREWVVEGEQWWWICDKRDKQESQEPEDRRWQRRRIMTQQIPVRNTAWKMEERRIASRE